MPWPYNVSQRKEFLKKVSRARKPSLKQWPPPICIGELFASAAWAWLLFSSAMWRKRIPNAKRKVCLFWLLTPQFERPACAITAANAAREVVLRDCAVDLSSPGPPPAVSPATGKALTLMQAQVCFRHGHRCPIRF